MFGLCLFVYLFVGEGCLVEGPQTLIYRRCFVFCRLVSRVNSF